MAPDPASGSDLVENCLEKGYRKALNLAYWGLISSCHHYDEYGSGTKGIVNLLAEKGINVMRSGKSAVIDTEGRLYVYKEDAKDIPGILDAYQRKRAIVAMMGRVAELVVWHIAETAPNATAFGKILELIIKNIDVINLVYEYLENAAEPLKIEEEAKKRMIAGDWGGGKALTLALAVKTLPFLDVDKFVETFEASVGMALSVAHEAALLAVIGEHYYPDDVEKIEEVIKKSNVENKTIRILMFAAKYLKAVRELADVINDDDYDKIKVSVSGGKLYLRLGAHHAEVTVSGTTYYIKYKDHNKNRQKAVEEFFRRAGFEVSNGTIVVPHDRLEEAATAIAATTSADIQACIWIFEKAANVDELLDLRIKCANDEDDEDDECYDDDEDECYDE